MLKRYVLSICLIAIAIIICIYEYNYSRSSVYCEDYYKVIGLKDEKTNSVISYYDEVIEEFGSPIKEIVISNDIKEMHYKDYVLVMRKDLEMNYYIIEVIITDEIIKFGKYGIGIGTSKALVEYVYRFKYREKWQEAIRYMDGIYNIFFEYDINNKVKSISISYADIH